jgi:hypothetical protein
MVMSVAELKLSAFEQLAAIHQETHLKQILDYLTVIARAEKEPKDMQAVFDKAVEQYGPVLEKLAQ